MNDIKKKFPRVAIVADQLVALGGAEREMFSMLKVIPYADIYTIVFDKKKFPNLKNNVYTSFVQNISKFLPHDFYRHLKIFTPFAYESFDLQEYDLVISISAGPAKGIITGIYQPHIAMTMTPPRSLWDKELNVRGSIFKPLYNFLSIPLNTYMRVWDWTISRRVDYWTANSEYIRKKIWKIYKKKATVIYPGVESLYFKKSSRKMVSSIKTKYQLPDNFVLVVSRLFDHKRIDWAIEACKQTNKNLVIVGDGPDRAYLERIAEKSPNIIFLGFLSEDIEVKTMYEMADVLLFCGLEDFGLVPIEAMASGTPVLGYKDGGLLETIIPGVSGEFFSTVDELVLLLKEYDKRRYNRKEITGHAKSFSEEIFINNFKKYLDSIYEKESKKRSRG